LPSRQFTSSPFIIGFVFETLSFLPSFLYPTPG
jgi:hypothetical protein